MELWEEKWEEFKRNSLLKDVKTYKGYDKEGWIRMNYGQEVYDALPEKLYHVTSERVWKKCQQDGYLGFYYKDYGQGKQSYWLQGVRPGDRIWQKAGWGVFFCASIDQGIGLAAPEEVHSETVPLVGLTVLKSNLDPNKFYLDGDIYGQDPEDSEVTGLPTRFSVFYADKVPVKYLNIVDREEWY